MKTMTVEVPGTQYEVTVPSFKGFPVSTKLSNDQLDAIFKNAGGMLLSEWESGTVHKVKFRKKIEEFDISLFNSADKGAIGTFIFDKNGDIVAGIVHHEDGDENNHPVECGEHIFIKSAASTNECWDD